MKVYNLPHGRTSRWVWVFGLAVLFLPIVVIEADVLRYTGRVFMYPLDDTFIHLEIAHNLAKGNWGINENEFAAASSSLLYTVILTIFRLFSGSTLVPFLVNCLAGSILILSVYLWLKKQGVNPIAQALILLLAIFFTPLPTMIISGMEHTLQCLFSFLFVYYLSDWLEKNRNNSQVNLPWSILAFAMLVSAIRYEGLFLVGVAGLILIYYRKWKSALILGFIAILPVLIFGIYSVSKGSYFLPNSVLVKSETNSTGLVGFFSNILVEKLTYAKSGMAALATQRWTIILPLLYLLFRKYLRPSYSFILIFLMAGTIIHLSLAATGWLYRYEAYLFFCSIIITALLFYKYGREVLSQYTQSGLRIIALVVVFFLFFPIVLRSITALAKVDRACKNIYDQQYQMAQFSRKNYDTSVIAANDIGAISYFTKAPIVDLWGLANVDVAKSRKNKYWTPQYLDSLCRAKSVKVAMIYDSWFDKDLTSRWKKVATWQIQNNVICGDDTVSFYALNNADSAVLNKRLVEFQPQLPPSVAVKYY